jgi:iron complex transport system substrate-binding protein
MITFLLLVQWVPSLFAETKTVRDAAGRTVTLPGRIERVLCSGPGSLRLLTYLQAQDRIIAVDDIEKRHSKFDARPYAFANPQFRDYPVFGNFRGHDNPELIMALDPQPQVILKTFPTMGHDPVELQKKTGISVVVLEYGNLTSNRDSLYQALRVMGAVVDKEKRAEDVIAFFESTIKGLKARTEDIPESEKSTCFVGGIAFKGPHGFQSTEPGYPPFIFVNAKNVAYRSFMKGKVLRQSNVAKEKIVEWDPKILFLDLSSLQMGAKAGGLFELKTDRAYQALTAVAEGEIYGVLPYNWYTQNFGSILANAFFIGPLLYPDRFTAVDPIAKADEIYTFLVGKPVFGKMDRAFQGLALKKVPLN